MQTPVTNGLVIVYRVSTGFLKVLLYDEISFRMIQTYISLPKIDISLLSKISNEKFSEILLQ